MIDYHIEVKETMQTIFVILESWDETLMQLIQKKKKFWEEEILLIAYQVSRGLLASYDQPKLYCAHLNRTNIVLSGGIFKVGTCKI